MMKKTLLSATEIQSLKEDQKEVESALKELQGGAGAGTKGSQIDPTVLKRQITTLGKKILDGTPSRIKGVAVDRLATKARELEDRIKVGMPTWDQMRNPSKHPGIVRKNFEWQKRNAKDIMEYKQIKRQLEPSDPSAASVETFRTR